MNSEILIIGGGIIGSAIAYELTRRGATDVHILDVDLDGALSSTERNAGGVRHLWQNPVNIELAQHSIDFFHEIGDEIGFQKSGYLWLYSKEEAQLAQSIYARTQEAGLDYELWDTDQVRNNYPFIDHTEDLSCALFGKRDGIINANRLRNYYRQKATERGALFHNGIWVEKWVETKQSVQLHIKHILAQQQAHQILKTPKNIDDTELEIFHAQKVILSLGAWTGPLMQQSGFNPFTLPIRRQIAVFKSPQLDLSPYGMVVDTSRVYFHPEGGNILSGLVLKDEPAGFNFHYDSNFFEDHLWPALYHRSSHFESLKWVTGWSGLYSYTPDTTGILGIVPGTKNVFEAHSFTGRGVMQSYGVAKALSELVLDNRFSSIDASTLSSLRFQHSDQLLFENLHI